MGAPRGNTVSLDIPGIRHRLFQREGLHSSHPSPCRQGSKWARSRHKLRRRIWIGWLSSSVTYLHCQNAEDNKGVNFNMYIFLSVTTYQVIWCQFSCHGSVLDISIFQPRASFIVLGVTCDEQSFCYIFLTLKHIICVVVGWGESVDCNFSVVTTEHNGWLKESILSMVI